MKKPLLRLTLLCIHSGCLALLSAHGAAQLTKYAVTPAGCEFHPGNSNNTYPFRGISAHYQQIHDSVDMAALNAGGLMVMTHIGFRPAASYAIAARQWDVQLSLSPTSVKAALMSTTFSANVTTTPTVVLPYTTISAPSGTGAGGIGAMPPNKILWSFPYKTLFLYQPGPNRNLLWEWQSKNGNAYTSTFMDACSGTTSPAPRAGQNAGTGCAATGQTTPAQAQAFVDTSTASLTLVNAAASAQALLWVGVQRTTISGPWCSSLYVNPLIAVGGSTDSSGTWKPVSVSAASLPTASYWEAFAQFGFADKGLPGGFGLSDLAAFAGPGNVGKYVSRLWVVNSANGHENDPTGSRGTGFGLVTMFTIK